MEKRWEHIFEGRGEVLKELKRIWVKAKQGEPQFTVLLGETGLGKTRLVQEFYAYLSKDTTEDPNNYWPAKLDVGRNLELNPPIDAFNPEIDLPWLWWGMRFPVPEDRNKSIVKSPFEIGDSALRAHVEPIVRMRNSKKANRDAAMTLVSNAGDALFVPIIGPALAVRDLIKYREQEKRNQKLGIPEAVAKRVDELVEETIDKLTMFMDSRVKDTPTVPVILVLDDAQWIDSITLNAVLGIFNHAIEHQWPLMLLCTHWFKEWQHYADFDCENRAASNLKQVYGSIRAKDQRFVNLINLTKLDPNILLNVARLALPGLSPEEHQRLIVEADGNPRAMEEMIRLLLNRPEKYFEGGNAKSYLSNQGKNALAKLQKTDLYQKVLQRFEDLDGPLQDVLTTGALFGPLYLRPLVYELLVATKDTKTSTDDMEKLSEKAEKLHALLQRLSLNSDSFQQKVYHKVARDYLREEDKERFDQQNKGMADVFNSWLNPDKYSILDQAEQLQLFETALLYVAESESNILDIQRLANIFDVLIETYKAKSNYAKVAEWWCLVLGFSNRSWYVEMLGYLENASYDLYHAVEYDILNLDRVMDILVIMEPQIFTNSRTLSSNSRFEWLEAGGHLYLSYAGYSGIEKSMIYFIESVRLARAKVNRSRSEEYLAFLARSLYSISMAYENKGDMKAAREHLSESIEIEREILAEFGNSLDRSRNLSFSMIKIGDIDRRQSKFDSASRYFKESLLIAENILTNYGETITALDHKSIVLNYLGSFEQQRERTASAQIYFEESLFIVRKIVSDYGPTPKRLMNLSGCLNVLAELDSSTGNLSGAQIRYEESLSILKQVISDYGATQFRCLGISGRMNCLAKLSQKQGESCLALEQMYESLNIGRQILSEFGENIECMEIMSDSLEFIAVLRLKQGDEKAALAAFEEKIAILQGTISHFGKTEGRLRSLAFIMFHTANLNRGLGFKETACQRYQESLSTNRQVISNYGRSYNNLRGVLVTTSHLASLDNEQGAISSARNGFEECMYLCEEILYEYEEARTSDIPQMLLEFIGFLLDFAKNENNTDVVSLYEKRLAEAQRRILEF